VATDHAIDLVEVKRWSEVEGKRDEFAKIEHELLRSAPAGGTS
jgi:hypothetical protein